MALCTWQRPLLENPNKSRAIYLAAQEVDFDNLVNLLLTISIKVNLPSCGMSRIVTTGDDHEVQESDFCAWSLVVAVRPWLERRRRHRLIEFRPLRPDFCGNLTICGSARIVFLCLGYPSFSEAVAHLPRQIPILDCG